jgi:hypothetical protein
MHSRNCVPYPAVTWIVSTLLALVSGITTILCVVAFASEHQITGLESKVTQLQAKIQALECDDTYHRLVVLTVDPVHNPNEESTVPLAPGQRLKFKVEANYDGELEPRCRPEPTIVRPAAPAFFI